MQVIQYMHGICLMLSAPHTLKCIQWTGVSSSHFSMFNYWGQSEKHIATEVQEYDRYGRHAIVRTICWKSVRYSYVTDSVYIFQIDDPERFIFHTGMGTAVMIK